MITFKSYQQILRNLNDNGIRSRTVQSLHDRGPVRGELFIKHDVEARVDRALRMAEIEAAEGHRATYYFQGDLLQQKATKNCVRRVVELGHEATLHYDVLDANNGDFPTAIEQFTEFLNVFERLGCPVTTVCPHGNPTKIRFGWSSNKDFFRNSDVRLQFPEILDIVVDFTSIFAEGTYLSDAGFTLRTIGNIDTNDKSNESAMKDGVEIAWENITDAINASGGLILSAHPHRFEEVAARLYLRKLVFFALRKAYMTTKNLPFVPIIADKFHTLTRRL
jgi:hypothetical protein